MSPKLAANVATSLSSRPASVPIPNTIPHTSSPRARRSSPSLAETMHVLAAIGFFSLGCVIAAALPRPLEQDKRSWHRGHKAAKPTRDGPRRVGRRH